MKKHLFLFLLPLAALFVSCDKERLFEENRELPDHTWTERNKLAFDVQIPDSSQLYNFYFNLRNADDYPYSNIYIFMNTALPNGKFRRDTVEFVLSDENGRWLGKGQGDIWDNQILFRKGMRFPVAGKYHIELGQAMRRQSLPGIYNAGIRIEKYEPK